MGWDGGCDLLLKKQIQFGAAEAILPSWSPFGLEPSGFDPTAHGGHTNSEVKAGCRSADPWFGFGTGSEGDVFVFHG